MSRAGAALATGGPRGPRRHRRQARPPDGGGAVLRARHADGRRPAPPPGRRASATSCSCGPCGAAGAAAALEVVRSLGRPDVARDVVEALMYDRGHHRRFADAIEDEARGRRRAARRGAAARPDRARRPSRSTRSRRRTTTTPSRSSATATALRALRAHRRRRRRSCARAPRSTPRRSGAETACTCRARSSRCSRASLSNEACSLVPGPAAADRDGRGAARPRRAGAQRVLLPQHDPLRCAARLRATWTTCSPGGSGRRRRSPSRWRSRASLPARLRDRRLARGALAVESSEPEFDFDERGNVIAARDEIQTESHWVIEHLMILANEQVAEHLSAARVGTIYRVHEQPDPASVERLVAQLASLDVPTPPLPKQHHPAAGRASWSGEISRARARVPARDRAGAGGRSARSCCARSSRPSTPTATSAMRGSPAARYCHFTSPIRRYPDLVVHRGAALHPGRGRARREADLGRDRRALQRDRARGGHAGARRRRHLPGLPARAHAGGGGLGARLRGRGDGRDRERRVRELRPRRRRRAVGGLPARAPHARRLLRPERGAHGADRPPQRPAAAARRPARPSRVRSIDAPRGRVDLELSGWTDA